MNPGEKYDDNMNAYMTLAQGIDLTNYQNTYLSYQVQYDTELDFDYFRRYESDDGIIWYPKEFYEGNGGWDYINISIPSGGMYYVKFVFFSDYSNSTYDGVYIDDIEITGDPIAQPQPNLTYNLGFSFDGPIVISQIPNTNVSDVTLYGGQQTYIDWSIINIGDYASGSFNVNLDIDGVTETTWTVNNLIPNQDKSIYDYKKILNTGWHDIELYIDPSNQVNESDEFDNWYWKSANWIASEVSFSGGVSHMDLNTATGQQLKSSANIKVQLMDKDSPKDRLIAETTTNSAGNFFFSNISNVDTDATNLDLYLKLFAENSASFVTSSLGGNIITDNSPVYNNIPPGSYDTTIIVNTQVNDFFYVVNTLEKQEMVGYN